MGAGDCRAQVERERVKAGPARSGFCELELAQGVEGAFADLAGDGQSGHDRVAFFALLLEGFLSGASLASAAQGSTVRSTYACGFLPQARSLFRWSARL